ncbi:MAG: c-type cytochrome [Burkholderiaceae bacterium]
MKLRSGAHALAVSIVAALLALIAAPARSQAGAPSSQGGGSNIQPALLYHNSCSVCHGDKGDGKSRASNSLSPPPYDFTSAKARSEQSRERIVAFITNGKPGTAMVSWKTQLNEREIAALADYVFTVFVQGNPAAAAAAGGQISGTRAHGGRESSPAPAVVKTDMSLGFGRSLKGNAAKGRTFYDANCATCHGTAGDGKGPRAYFINPKPRDFREASFRSRANRPMLFAAVGNGRNGTEMPAWNKVLNDQQIADVSEYVFQSFILNPAQAKADTKAPSAK